MHANNLTLLYSKKLPPKILDINFFGGNFFLLFGSLRTDVKYHVKWPMCSKRPPERQLRMQTGIN